MKFRIEKYLLKKADELAFITIKNDGDFKLKGYTLPSKSRIVAMSFCEPRSCS